MYLYRNTRVKKYFLFFQAEDQLDTEMLCKIIGLFKEINQRNNKLQLGLTISSYKQSIRSSKLNMYLFNMKTILIYH